MSHFSVIVIGDNPEKQLAPYQENNMGNCPEEFLEFNDQEDEFRKEYEEKGFDEWVVMPDDRLLMPWCDEFRNPDYTLLGDKPTHKVPDHLERRSIPHKERHATFEEYVKFWHGQKRNEKTGRFGYWENPNAKWDWYQIGGRWRGYFPVKKGGNALLVGKPGVGGNKADPNTADMLFRKDVDLERARNEAEQIAAVAFDCWEAIYTEHGQPESWESIRNRICGADPNFDYSKIDEARKPYRAQPAIQAASGVKVTDPINGKEFHLSIMDCPVERYGFDRETYLKQARNQALVPYAVVINGNWHGRGEMGMFGISREEMDRNEWCEQFHKLLDDLPPDTLLTAVDCHI